MIILCLVFVVLVLFFGVYIPWCAIGLVMHGKGTNLDLIKEEIYMYIEYVKGFDRATSMVKD